MSFVATFSPGDKVYGLASQNMGRNRYINTVEFRKKFGHLDCTTDELNNRFLGTGALDDPAIFNSALMWGVVGTKQQISPEQSGITDLYREYLDTHPKIKYRPSSVVSLADRNLRVSRACKAALEFTTVKCSRRIHFILDDIDLEMVMTKRSLPGGQKSITGQELRYIYRNSVMLERDDVEVAPDAKEGKEDVERRILWNYYLKIRKTRQMIEHITFWFGGNIVQPPWADSPRNDLWLEYYGRYYQDKLQMTRKFISKVGAEYQKKKEDHEKEIAKMRKEQREEKRNNKRKGLYY